MSHSSNNLRTEKVRDSLATVQSFEDLGGAVNLMTDVRIPHGKEDATLFLKRVLEILAEPKRFGLDDLSQPNWQWFGRVVWEAYSNPDLHPKKA